MSNRSRISPRWKWLGRAAYAAILPVIRIIGRLYSFNSPQSAFASERILSMREKLARGETVYVLGIGPGGHNAGVGLIEASARDGIRLIGNHEEERFRAVKHYQRYPSESVQVLLQQMRERGIEPAQIHAACASFDYGAWTAKAVQTIVEEFPGSLRLLRHEASPSTNLRCILEATTAPRELGKLLNGSHRPFPVISLRHHDNHAWLSWGVSPFADSPDPVMVLVVDGAGDDCAISSYVVEQGTLRLLQKNDGFWDSLGQMYGFLSSALGGWPLLSSEGRFMGAAAWGNLNRLTNPYYSRLRDIFVFESEGRVFLNRALANWHRGGCLQPFRQRLTEILGAPLLPDQMWDPNAVLRVEDIAHAPITQDRVDKAAAVQLVFEDALFHIVQHLIRTTRSTRLVLTGGTALNCVANMLLMEHFNTEWYERYLGMKNTTLHVWIPPVPGDMGVPIGAAYHFACLAGARPGEPLQHAFYCGLAPRREEIEESLRTCTEIRFERVGNIRDPNELERLADLMALIVSREGIIGIYQGAAETGPRALGHRSILANPTNPQTRETLNRLVKFRELIRPLAPMATLEAAQRWFHLAEGASDDDYNAYNYMVLTARAKPEAFSAIPSVIHHDGTSRVQIVRKNADPLIHAYLKAMGRRVGVEVSVNTSLNVGAPIAQTPTQALETLQRSKGMHGLFMIAEEGDAFLAWHHIEATPKDAGRTLNQWVAEWRDLHVRK
jgi:carbamoyltransferase